MGKHKTERTEQLIQAVRHYTVGEQARQAIEQHNFEKMVRSGVIVEGGLKKDDDPQRGGACLNHNVPRNIY
jgi:hypothetical protein